MRIRHTAAALAVLACALTACTSSKSSDQGKAKPKTPASQEQTREQKDDASAATGIPKDPTGADRQKLIATLTAVAPDVARYEDKAVDAARNQCSAITGGAGRLDWLASQRFSYKDVTTTEEQGAKINAALKRSGFCNVT